MDMNLFFNEKLKVKTLFDEKLLFNANILKIAKNRFWTSQAAKENAKRGKEILKKVENSLSI